jgi:prepilin-type processing-associated H-X9-DG protein
MKHRQQGFSLKEILVIIAIIATLTAILFPIFAQAREKAKQISCLSNHRQLAMGVIMYMQDYDERFPMTANLSTPQKTLWIEVIYMKSREVFICPQAKRDSFLKRSNLTTLYADSWENRTHASIGMNAQFLFDKNGKEGFKKVVAVENLESPADTIILADTFNPPVGRQQSGYEGGYMFDPCSAQSKDTVPPLATPDMLTVNAINAPHYAIIARHRGFCNLTFADGHAMAKRTDNLKQWKWRFRGCDFNKGNSTKKFNENGLLISQEKVK